MTTSRVVRRRKIHRTTQAPSRTAILIAGRVLDLYEDHDNWDPRDPCVHRLLDCLERECLDLYGLVLDWTCHQYLRRTAESMAKAELALAEWRSVVETFWRVESASLVYRDGVAHLMVNTIGRYTSGLSGFVPELLVYDPVA